ncbi:flavodoxin family protein [uncultured Clostridium sp.]|uniref:flavodoxin family protein n=1 Tax=uncultured Clostridium sp. TaxID=59620 RepID=UPI002627519A|nr:flavodoxin family protein [uncultured Clostridium sp.]
MKCVVIHGSPRRGNTWDVLEKVKEEMNKYGEFEFEVIELAKEKIPNCIGCFNCILKGEETCPHSERMENIISKVDEAECLIVTSSVYSMNVTGTLKTFLDHMSFKFHRPTYFEKKALVVTTTAGAGHEKVGNYIKEVLEYWGINSIKVLPIAYRSEILTDKNIKKIEKMGKEFALELESKKLRKPRLKSVFMYNGWKAMAMNSSHESADYKHWKWKATKDVLYDENVKIGLISKVVGKFGYKVMKKATKK